MLGRGQTSLGLVRVLSRALDSFEGSRAEPSLAFRVAGRGPAYAQCLSRLAPALGISVVRIPKGMRRLAGSKFRAEPTHVGPALRFRSALRAASLAYYSRTRRGLSNRVL